MVTAEQVFSRAKRVIMREGNYHPTIIVVTKDAEYTMSAPMECWNGTTREKIKGMFIEGREFALDNHEGHESIEIVYLVPESWFAPDKPDGVRISELPDKREAINVLAMSLVNDGQSTRQLTQKIHVSEIIRHGAIVDLVPHGVFSDVASDLLPAFLSGVISSEYSDDELRRMVENGGKS